MSVVQVTLALVVEDPVIRWGADWLWGLPLIVLTVIIHVLGLGLIGQRAVGFANAIFERRHPILGFAGIVGTTTLLATCLHALEAALWAAAYRILGALPDRGSAMLYSLSAITSYGHAAVTLAPHWQLLGALEALNGWLLFGLTTAFLFAMIDKIWAVGANRVQSATPASRSKVIHRNG